jgi:hypothetical protein
MSTQSVTGRTYETLLASMADDAAQLQQAALRCESLIPHVVGKMQQARIQLTAAVFREQAERLDQIVSFVRSTENKQKLQ